MRDIMKPLELQWCISVNQVQHVYCEFGFDELKFSISMLNFEHLTSTAIGTNKHKSVKYWCMYSVAQKARKGFHLKYLLTN